MERTLAIGAAIIMLVSAFVLVPADARATSSSPGPLKVCICNCVGMPPCSTGITASVSASPSPVVVLSQAVITVTASGGKAPYTYSYSNLPIGCSSSNTASLKCTPTQPGYGDQNTIDVTVTDSAGSSVTVAYILTEQSPPNTIDGWVTTSTGTAIGGAYLELDYYYIQGGTVYPELKCTTTDSATGYFSVTPAVMPNYNEWQLSGVSTQWSVMVIVYPTSGTCYTENDWYADYIYDTIHYWQEAYYATPADISHIYVQDLPVTSFWVNAGEAWYDAVDNVQGGYAEVGTINEQYQEQVLNTGISISWAIGGADFTQSQISSVNYYAVDTSKTTQPCPGGSCGVINQEEYREVGGFSSYDGYAKYSFTAATTTTHGDYDDYLSSSPAIPLGAPYASSPVYQTGDPLGGSSAPKGSTWSPSGSGFWEMHNLVVSNGFNNQYSYEMGSCSGSGWAFGFSPVQIPLGEIYGVPITMGGYIGIGANSGNCQYNYYYISGDNTNPASGSGYCRVYGIWQEQDTFGSSLLNGPIHVWDYETVTVGTVVPGVNGQPSETCEA